MSDANSAPKPLFKTFGAALLGTFIGAMLYGCICMLVYRYFREYRKDRWWFKYMVGFLLLVDTLHTAFSIHYCYYYLVSRFEQPEVRASAVWSLLTANLLTVFPPFVSNMFYLSRLWKIGQKNWLIIGGLFFLIIARLALETANQVLGYMHPVFSDFIRFHYYVKAYCAVSSVVDTLLAVFIIRKLRHASRSLLRAAKIVDVIVVYLLGAGALTGVVCMLSLFASIFLTGGLVDVTLHAILGKLYIISVLAVLNSRHPHTDASDAIRDKFLRASTFGVDETTSERSMLTATITTVDHDIEFRGLHEKDYRGPTSSATYRFEPDSLPNTPGSPGFGSRITYPPSSTGPYVIPQVQVQQTSETDITMQSERAQRMLSHAGSTGIGGSPHKPTAF